MWLVWETTKQEKRSKQFWEHRWTGRARPGKAPRQREKFNTVRPEASETRTAHTQLCSTRQAEVGHLVQTSHCPADAEELRSTVESHFHRGQGVTWLGTQTQRRPNGSETHQLHRRSGFQRLSEPELLRQMAPLFQENSRGSSSEELTYLGIWGIVKSDSA